MLQFLQMKLHELRTSNSLEDNYSAAFDMDISEPSLLTRLPHAIGSNGRSLFAQVHGIRNGVKRKRQEICAAIDGNSVNIYEAQYGRTISSFPVPPETIFECPPCSVRSRTDIVTTRSTYCVTKRRSQLQLQCFSEIISKDEAKQRVSSAKLVQQQGTVILLDYVSWSNTAGVLVLWETGHFSLLTPDLSVKISEGQFSLPDAAGKLLACHCASVLDASKSILKARPDITTTAGLNAIIVAGVTRTSSGDIAGQENLKYCVWTLPCATTSTSADLHLPLALSHVLTLSTNFKIRERDGVAFLFKGNRISVRSHARSAVFELASIMPQKISDSSLPMPEYVSDLPISDNLSLVSSSSGLYLYNTQFQSVQASLDLSKTALKRRRGGEPHGPITFIAYFPQLNRIVGTRRGHLAAIDLNMSQTTNVSAAMKRSSTLINNIGKGTPDRGFKFTSQTKKTALGNVSKPGLFADGWSSTSKKLEECVSRHATDEFEDTYLNHISSSASPESSSRKPHDLDGEVDYILSKLFQSTNRIDSQAVDNAHTLEVVLPARRLLNWLITQGHLTRNRIVQALFASSKGDLSHSLESDSIIHALSAFDQSLSVVKQFLHEAPYIDLQTLCAAVKMLIRKALTLSGSSTVPMGEVGSLETGADPAVTDTLATLPADNLAESVSVTDVATTLIKALERLSEYDPRILSATLRSDLEQQDLIALIQFLRQQLFQNGYTRSIQSQPYPSPPPSVDGTSKPPEVTANAESSLSLDAILSIMSCCVDVIGPLGLISSEGDMQFVQTLIPELSSEINRTIEALEDASQLQGFLRETLRYSASTGIHANKFEGSNQDSVRSRSKIVTVYAESTNDRGAVKDTSALPLSLRMDHKVSPTKVRKGGGQVLERSKREMGMLQDRLRAPYALERLVL